MEILVSTGSLAPRSFSDAAHLAQAAGADGLEVLLNRHLLAVGPDLARETAAECGVPIHSVHPPLRLIHHAGDAHADVIAAAEYAAAIPGCRILVMHTVGGAGLHTQTGRAFLDTVNAASDILAPSTARLTLENRSTVQPQPKPDFLDRLLNLYRVCEEWDLGITFDTAHAAAYGLHVVTALDVVLPRLKNIHLSDRREDPPTITSPLLSELTREHQMPGEGALPLSPMLRRLRAKGYTGTITLELSPLAVKSWNSHHALTRLTKAVAFVRERFADLTPPPSDHPARRNPRPDRLSSEP